MSYSLAVSVSLSIIRAVPDFGYLSPVTIVTTHSSPFSISQTTCFFLELLPYARPRKPADSSGFELSSQSLRVHLDISPISLHVNFLKVEDSQNSAKLGHRTDVPAGVNYNRRQIGEDIT